jgi:hypothetical protein
MDNYAEIRWLVEQNMLADSLYIELVNKFKKDFEHKFTLHPKALHLLHTGILDYVYQNNGKNISIKGFKDYITDKKDNTMLAYTFDAIVNPGGDVALGKSELSLAKLVGGRRYKKR